MSFSTTVSFSTEISSLSLENHFAQSEIKSKLPLDFTLNDERLALNEGHNIDSSKPELVVFSDLTLQNLLLLQGNGYFTIDSLIAINTRNNQTSYRFNVTCTDFIKSRQAIADFALANKIEAALILNAPKLNTPGLLVMDMDSTTIEIECIDEIAKLAGVGEEVSAVTELAMQGQLDFSQSLHQRVATLANAPENSCRCSKKHSINGGIRNIN